MEIIYVNCGQRREFYLFEAISLVKTKKNRVVVYLPPEETKTETSLSFLVLG